jgi:hypothetical protein
VRSANDYQADADRLAAEAALCEAYPGLAGPGEAALLHELYAAAYLMAREADLDESLLPAGAVDGVLARLSDHSPRLGDGVATVPCYGGWGPAGGTTEDARE